MPTLSGSKKTLLDGPVAILLYFVSNRLTPISSAVKLILAFCILSISLTSVRGFSQDAPSIKDSILLRYDTASIIMVGNKCYINQKRFRTGLFMSKLLKKVEGSELAEKEIRLYRKKQIIGSVIFYSGYVAAFTGLVVLSPAVVIVGLAGIVVGVIPIVTSMNHPPKAAWHYNRDVIAGD